MKEQRVGVRELKANLSSVLREIKAGKTILITERGKAVGRILPADASVHEMIEEGTRRRLWYWSGRKWNPSTPKFRRKEEIEVSDLLLDDRE